VVETKSVPAVSTDSPNASPPLTAAWLTSRVFAFRSGPQRQLLSSSFRFEPDGRISGYVHPNESAWRIEDGKLIVSSTDGVPTCIASPTRNDDDTLSLIGVYLLEAGDCVHRFDEIGGAEQRPEVMTFDLFDTLVARRCFEPEVIFRLVEQHSGVTDFARLRRSVEKELWGRGEYSFDDIYAALEKATDWPARTLTTLRMLELAEEWDNLFPVREVVERVGPNDIVVSDMYLPLSFLRRVVDEKCGLEGRAIHLSSHGKHHGTVWPRIQSTHRIRRHHGDNRGSDVNTVEQAGIVAEHVTLAKWTRGEKILIEAGLTPFAEAVREARLRSFDPAPWLRRAQLAQFELNLPLLIVASLDVLRSARERGVDTLLMCSRDCNLWITLMRWMVAHSSESPAVRYLAASRDLFLSGSLEYAAYFLRMRGQRNMIVDVSGTGLSPANFIANLGVQAHTSVFLTVFSWDVSEDMAHLAPARDLVDIAFLTEQPYERRFALEQLNMSVQGQAARVEFTGQSFEVQREPVEFGPSARVTLSVMRRAFLGAMSIVRSSGLRQLPDSIPAQTLRSAAEALIGLVDQYGDVVSLIQQGGAVRPRGNPVP